MKWVGGKTRLLPHLTSRYTGQRRVVEPFFGGGALSFALASSHPNLQVVANDQLAPVMAIYAAVRNDVDGFITAVDRYAIPYLAHDKAGRRAYYYELRDAYMRGEIDGPPLLFFMLWCAYSGLYRTGKTYPGRFNTSHGFGAEKPGFYHPANVRAAAELMGSWTLLSGDFDTTLDHVDEDTFVFLDPPYRDTYTGYTDGGFSAADQQRVVDHFHAAAERGATVVYTNKDTGDGWYDERFPDAHIERVPIRYQVNRDCATNGRPQTFEVIVTSR